MTDTSPALDVHDLGYSYGSRRALEHVSFAVPRGEIFGLLGPNGGGKTTLFRIISTLLKPASGTIHAFGRSVVDDPAGARHRMGVVFQSPALDNRLTVSENLRHHGHLYGLKGGQLRDRVREALGRVGLADRAHEIVQRLSGGLRRRAEIAKAFLHAPDMLVLDEPSTGLDPAARRDIREHLRHLRQQSGTTVVLTTHLMDEAGECDRLAILDAGRLVTTGSPRDLVDAVGGEITIISAREPDVLAPKIAERFKLDVKTIEGRLRIERRRAHEFVTDLVEAFPGEIDSVSFGKPTLEDVFVHFTGRNFRSS